MLVTRSCFYSTLRYQRPGGSAPRTPRISSAASLRRLERTLLFLQSDPSLLPLPFLLFPPCPVLPHRVVKRGVLDARSVSLAAVRPARMLPRPSSMAGAAKKQRRPRAPRRERLPCPRHSFLAPRCHRANNLPPPALRAPIDGAPPPREPPRPAGCQPQAPAEEGMSRGRGREAAVSSAERRR